VRIALMGTRGVPARYGGFETAVEEVGCRLVDLGHEVVVYCREPGPAEHLGMKRVEVRSLRHKMLETLSSTALATAHAVRQRPDVVVLFNAANAPLLPVLRAARLPVATHVDGLEWKRAKWSGAGRRYYRAAEALAVRWSDALIADSVGIADYYAAEFGAPTEHIAYGAPRLADPGTDLLGSVPVEPGKYHLVVARFEPENHVEEIVAGYRSSAAALPLVVVGSAPYAEAYTAAVTAAAGGDPRILLVGGVWDQRLLDQFYASALTYVHGHSVGGTNPSLLRAMGAGTATLAWDVPFNREVLGDSGRFFRSPAELARLLEAAEADPAEVAVRGARARVEAERYDWDDVAKRYEQLCQALAAGRSSKGQASGRRRAAAVAADGPVAQLASLPTQETDGATEQERNT
jgi:glycosyltransferase involved in cell wall biosynthesis